MVTDEKGLKLIKFFEGCSLNLYNDCACPPNATIGIGHLVHLGPIDGTEPEQFKAGISQEEALDLLAADVEHTEFWVAEIVKVPLNQDQFDALVSFTFNVGVNALKHSTALARFNSGDYGGASEAFNMWVNSGEYHRVPSLVKRRAAEQILFNTGAIPA